jgi:sensor histidine kinase YesM
MDIRPGRKELLYRWIGIVAMGILFPLLFDNHHFELKPLLLTILISMVHTALYWNGTMYVALFVIKLFPTEKKLYITIVALFLFVGIFVLLVTFLSALFFAVLHGVSFTGENFGIQLLICLLITYFISTFYAATFFFKQWKMNAAKAENLEKAQLEAQYETLKNQVNPHFLFNSLNTLLSMVEGNPSATKYVENLSEFMRYILQTREKEVVLLRDEITMARQYIFIQQSRFGDKLQVPINIPEAFYHYAVPPLSIQMLLENAIKHNVVSREHPLVISLFVDEKKYLVVENKIHRKEDTEPSTGIGINNIKKRYLYLSGKDVVISEENGIFKVSLPLVEFKL